MSGWIKIHRSITDHWLYTEKRVFSKFEAWNDILLTVNYTECRTLIKGKLYTVKRGQSILSLDSWGKRWGWDKSKVRRFMDLLVNDKMIELVTDNITTHLTVCKYDDYQDIRNANETQTKRKRNTDELQTTPIEEREEYKEGKEEKKEYTLEERKLKFASTLEPFLNIYGKEMLNAFYLYWTEPDQTKNPKMRFEKEKFWDINRRLVTWKNKEKSSAKKESTVSKNQIIFDKGRQAAEQLGILNTQQHE